MGNADDDNLIHIQATRSWWDGHAITRCGRRIDQPEGVWTWFTTRTWCPVCKATRR